MEIGIEAAQFPEKEYINGIFLAMSENISKSFCALYIYMFREAFSFFFASTTKAKLS